MKRIGGVHIRQFPFHGSGPTTVAELSKLKRLQQRSPERAEGLGLDAALIAARKGLTLPAGRKLLIVLDRFERWLHADRGGPEHGLTAALRQCDGEHLQALVVVRDDCWSSASRFLRDLGDRLVEGANAAAVEPFEPRHARKLLTALGRAYGT